MVRKDRAIVALELEGIALGLAPIQLHQWRAMNGAYSVIKLDAPPFETPRLRNFTELLALDIPPSSAKPGGVEFLHADIAGWRPTIGETVLGIGYPSLDKEEGGSDDRRISQYMHGAFGRITDIEQLNLNRTRPWPMVRVEADWPGGMSGGPVFNAAGNVIGIISAGIDANSSTAMVFGGWTAVHNTFPTLDPSRTGWFVCQATLSRDEQLLGVGLSRQAADEIAKKHHGAFACKISLDHATSKFVRLEL